MLGNQRTGQHTTSSILVGLLVLICTATSFAQLPVPASSQFDITGFLQEATLDGAGAGAHQGGHLKVNGHTVIVPAETIVILPANALTWQELFAQAPAPYAGVATGMAQADVPTPLTTYEVHVVGNRVGNDYIAGLIDISQQGLNSGAGFINFIDYATGEMRVGGVIGDSTTGARVRINDPNGRYGRATTSPDIRFTVDPDNPTIMSGTGYPMCFPRTAPANGATTDLNCPEENRPLLVDGTHAASFTTNNLTNPNFAPTAAFPNSTFQAPFEVGDYVTFAGTLVQDCALCPGGGTTAGPWPVAGAAATWISAHTIVNNVAIYTFPGSNPAYVMTDVTLIGTGGLTVLGAGEAAVRTRFEGMMTDPSRIIHLYGIDYNPATGTFSDRDWGMIGVDPGPAAGAVKGRWRFRPPCTAPLGSPTDKACSPPPAGSFLPPTREVRAVIVDPVTGAPANPGMTGTAANGLIYGQYHAPILEYIFPENIPGSPIVENNFNSIDFLAKGGYTSSAGTLVGILNPWPSNVLPAGICVAPTANAGGPYSAASGGTITLNGSATGSTPMTFAWTAAAGTFLDPTLASPNYTAPVVATQTAEALTLTATNACGSSVANSTVTVNAAAAPTASYTPASPVTVVSGTPVTLTGIGTDPNGLPVRFAWTQTNAGTPGVPTVLSPNPFTCAQTASPISCPISFNVSVPLGQTTPITIQLQAVATNSLGISSAPDFTSVTFNPSPDNISITAAEYRTSKQRLIINATDGIVSPNIVLTLAPYLTESGTTFDPASLGNTFTNNGGGLYILTLVGAPAPACNLGGTYATPCSRAPLVVRSNIGGSSAPTALTRIRQ